MPGKRIPDLCCSNKLVDCPQLLLILMPPDKFPHLLAGIATAAVVYPFGILWACLAVCLAAIGKEAYASTGRGRVEFMDAFTTVVGGVLLLGWYTLLLRI